jgi:hypothetical protein
MANENQKEMRLLTPFPYADYENPNSGFKILDCRGLTELKPMFICEDDRTKSIKIGTQ